MAKFTVEARLGNGRGRAGVIETPHGSIETPAFIPVGTKATVKSLTPEQVRDYIGAQAVLANTYHLYLQPGHELVQKAGGLHKFMNWQGPTFTDSGGFQAFSLGAAWGKGISKLKKQETKTSLSLADSAQTGFGFPASQNIVGEIRDDDGMQQAAFAKVDDDGVTFKSVIDGSTHRFTPESSIEIQHAIGADIIFAFDECASPDADYEYQKKAMERTREWAQRCVDRHVQHMSNTISDKTNLVVSALSASGELQDSSRHTIDKQSLFGIVQGGRFEDLRRESARTIGAMDFDGFGIGGSFDKGDVATAVGWLLLDPQCARG